MKRRDVLALGLSGLSARALVPSLSFAQAKYPDRPIRLVVPFPPGGVYDAVARPWADRMRSHLGSVVVENQAGAGGSLGAAAVARAQPDGYTLLAGGGGPMVVTPVATTRAPYDPIRDFEPIAILVVSALTLAVHPAQPFQSLEDVVDAAKKNPGRLSYGSAGVGTINHLTGELLKSLTATEIVHVPYRGAGPALTDLIAGQIPTAMANITGQVLELHRSGKLRMLAVTAPARIAAASDIPTAVEAGLPGMVAQNFVGLFAPRGTPAAIIEQIARATRAAMDERDFRELLSAASLEAHVDSSPAKARQFLEDEFARWTPVIKAIGLKLD